MKTIEERARLAAYQIYEEIGLSKHSIDRVSEIITEKILEQKIIDSVRADNYKLTVKMCNVYRDIVLKYQECQTAELQELDSVVANHKLIKQRYIVEWKKDLRDELNARIPQNTEFIKRLHGMTQRCSHKYKFNDFFADYFMELNEGIKKIKNA